MTKHIAQSRGVEPGCVWALLPAWIVISIASYWMDGYMSTERLILDIVFVIVLLGLGLFSTYTRRRFGETTLVIDALPVPGDIFRGTVETRITERAMSEFNVRLALVYEVRRGGRTVWETSSAVAPRETATGLHIPFTFAVPADAGGELQSRSRWKLYVRAAFGVIPFRAEFLITESPVSAR